MKILSLAAFLFQLAAGVLVALQGCPWASLAFGVAAGLQLSACIRSEGK